MFHLAPLALRKPARCAGLGSGRRKPATNADTPRVRIISAGGTATVAPLALVMARLALVLLSVVVALLALVCLALVVMSVALLALLVQTRGAMPHPTRARKESCSRRDAR